MVKAKAEFCPRCGKHWTKCYDPNYIPQAPSSEEWDWEKSTSSSARRRSSRSKSQQDRGRGRKGKDGKAGGKGKDTTGKSKDVSGKQDASSLTITAPSPFTQYQSGLPSTGPWTGETGSELALTVAPQPVPSANADLVAALLKAYPSREQMPVEVKELIEKTQMQEARSLTRDLHVETSNLGKARKLLMEIQEAKKTHKAAWLSHLKESVDLWNRQLRDFMAQQAELTEKENKATRDIQAANRAIQSLNSKAADATGGEALAPLDPVLKVEPNKDLEEEDLKKKLHKVFAECAAIAGVTGTEILHVQSDGEEEEEARRKRARSTEPPENPDGKTPVVST